MRFIIGLLLFRNFNLSFLGIARFGSYFGLHGWGRDLLSLHPCLGNGSIEFFHRLLLTLFATS